MDKIKFLKVNGDMMFFPTYWKLRVAPLNFFVQNRSAKDLLIRLSHHVFSLLKLIPFRFHKSYIYHPFEMKSVTFV